MARLSSFVVMALLCLAVYTQALPMMRDMLDNAPQIVVQDRQENHRDTTLWPVNDEDTEDDYIFGLLYDEDDDDWTVEDDQDMDLIPIKIPSYTPPSRIHALQIDKAEWNRYNDEDVNTALLMASSSDIDDHVMEMAIIARLKELLMRQGGRLH